MKKWSFIIGLWICWGFALGTALLLGPVRKSVDYARNNNWGDRRENLTVFFFIGLLAIVSFLLARYATKVILDGNKKRNAKLLHTTVPVVGALAALYILLRPGLVNADNSAQTNISAQFTIGPYPDADKIKQLKNEGYTALVSLLHPAVVPFEPRLLDEEQEIAQKLDMQVISIPMMPWVSDNQEAIDSFRRLVQTGDGKYYIHCYLGKDRVNVARRIIEQEKSSGPQMEEGLAHRSIDSLQKFERGVIYKLDNNAYLSPMPTKEEYLGYVVATNFKQVVSLTDFADAEANAEMQKEQGWLKSYGIAFKTFNIAANTDEARMKQVVDSVKQLPSPVFIHVFKTDLPEAQLFLKMYKGTTL